MLKISIPKYLVEIFLLYSFDLMNGKRIQFSQAVALYFSMKSWSEYYNLLIFLFIVKRLAVSVFKNINFKCMIHAGLLVAYLLGKARLVILLT